MSFVVCFFLDIVYACVLLVGLLPRSACPPFLTDFSRLFSGISLHSPHPLNFLDLFCIASLFLVGFAIPTSHVSAPDAEENSVVKRQLNSGEFVRCMDVSCIANLIKVSSAGNERVFT